MEPASQHPPAGEAPPAEADANGPLPPPGQAGPAGAAPPSPASPQPDGPPPGPEHVYAIGQLEPRFPSPGVEKEFAQALGQTDAAGLTDRQALQTVLSQRHHRYLARQLCYVFTIEGIDAYIVVPRDPADLDLLIEALRPNPRATDLDIVIGRRGPIAPPDACNGLMLPVVRFEQLYSFDVDTLIHNVPRPESIPEEQDPQFRAAAEEMFHRVMQTADNAGATDEHRAMNYLATRYPAIYTQTAQAHTHNQTLTGVEAHPSRLSGARTIIDVIFTYTDRATDVADKYFTRVDVTEQFPFLVSKLAPYYERP